MTTPMSACRQRVYTSFAGPVRPSPSRFYRFDCKRRILQSNSLDFWPHPNQNRVKKPNLHRERLAMSNWIVDRSRILQRDEIALVLTDLRRKARRSTNSRMNMVVFRLATCCGLRASEIAGLALADVQVDNSRPSIRVRREIGKGHKARKVPLTWDAGTLADLVEWKRFRREQGAADDDRFVCSQHCDSLGNPLDRRNLRKRFKASCKALGRERQSRVDDPRRPPFLRQPRPPRRP